MHPSSVSHDKNAQGFLAKVFQVENSWMTMNLQKLPRPRIRINATTPQPSIVGAKCIRTASGRPMMAASRHVLRWGGWDQAEDEVMGGS